MIDIIEIKFNLFNGNTSILKDSNIDTKQDNTKEN